MILRSTKRGIYAINAEKTIGVNDLGAGVRANVNCELIPTPGVDDIPFTPYFNKATEAVPSDSLSDLSGSKIH